MNNPRPLTPTKAFDWRWNLAVIGAFFVVLTVMGFAYTNYVQHQAEQRNLRTLRTSQQVWCSLLIGILKIPATTQASVTFHQQLYVIAMTYGCTGVPTVPATPVPIPTPSKPSPSTTATARG